MRLFDLLRYVALGMPEDPETDPMDDGYFTVTFATGVGRLIELFAADDDHRAFGGYPKIYMGISNKLSSVISHGITTDGEDSELLERIYTTLMRFQWWTDALERREAIDFDIARPTRINEFQAKVPDQLPQTNFYRALLAISWSLGRQLSVDPQEFDQHDKETVAAALGLAIEQELTDGTPFEETLRPLLLA